MSTFTVIKTNKIFHKWSISNFREYLECYEETKKSYYLFSSYFPTKTKYKNKFRLKLILKNVDDKDSIAIYLCGEELGTLVTTKNKFYIITNNNQKYNEKTLVLPGVSVFDTGLGFHSYMQINELLYKANELMPNNTLTIGCDLTVYDESVSTFPIYELDVQFSLSSQLKTLLDSQSGSDFTFHIDDKEIKVHKVILMARSPVFTAMFENEMIEKRTNQTTITDISLKIFELMIEYIYTDKINNTDLNNNDVAELLRAADKYQLQDLTDLCGKLLYDSLEIENATEIMTLAKQYNIKKLETNVEKLLESQANN